MEENNEKEIYEKLQKFYKEAGWFQAPSPSNHISSTNNTNPGKVFLTFELPEQKGFEIASIFFETESNQKSHPKPNKNKKKK